MFDQVPLGDEEIQFEVFPQSSDVSMPADLQAQIPQGDQEAAQAEFSHFWQTYRPIILRPLSGSQRGSSILIVPNGQSRNIRSVFRKTPQGLPDEGYNEPSFDVFTFNEKDQHLSLRHIDHLPIGQGKRGRDKVEREGMLEDMVYEPVHFVFCVKAFNGKTEALCVLEEVSTSNGKLKLQLREDRAIGRDDERGQLENRVIDKIQTYIEYVNAQELSAQEFREARERLRLNSEKLIGERATLGIRRNNVQEVVQAANKFNASCPEELKVSSFGGLRFGCPAVENDLLYAFFARTIRELDPKNHPFERDKTAGHLKCVV